MRSKDLFTDELTEIKPNVKEQKKSQRELELELKIAQLEHELDQKKPKIIMSISVRSDLKDFVDREAKKQNISASEFICRLIDTERLKR